MNGEMTIFEVFEKTHWAELAEQKRMLVELVYKQPTEGTEHPLEGLLNWIDAIQDAAADVHGYPVVFLYEMEEENDERV